MAQYYSKVGYLGNGYTTDFTIPFPYIHPDHIVVNVSGSVSSFEWVDVGLIRIAPAPPVDAEVAIYRVTPRDERLVDFHDGSPLRARDLDVATMQALFLVQELTDAQLDAFGTILVDGENTKDPQQIIDDMVNQIINTELWDVLGAEIERIDGINVSADDAVQRAIDAQDTAQAALEAQEEQSEAIIQSLLEDGYNFDEGLYAEHVTTTNAESTLTALLGNALEFEDGRTSRAMILREERTRVSEDEALAARIDLIVAQMSNFDGAALEAMILAEQTARVTAIDALTTTVNQEVSRLDAEDADIQAGLLSESTTRASADTALTTRIDTEVARLDTADAANQAAITAESTTRATEDSALATQISDLTTSIQTDALYSIAAVQAEATARTTEDAALSSRIDTVVADLSTLDTSLTAMVQAETTARIDGDTALTNTLNSEIARVDGSVALLQTETSTLATEQAATSTAITTLQTDVDGNTALVQEQATAIDGLEGQYTVKIEVDALGGDSYVAGFGLAVTPSLYDDTLDSTFIVRAENFAVGSPGRNATVPFVVDTVNNRVGISGDLLVSGTVSADALNVNNLSAIDADLGVITAGELYFPNSASKDPSQGGLYIASREYSTNLVMWYGDANINFPTWSNAKFALDRAGNAKFSGELQAASGTFSGTLTANNIVATNNIIGGAVTETSTFYVQGGQWVSDTGWDNIGSLSVTLTEAFEVLVHTDAFCSLPTPIQPSGGQTNNFNYQGWLRIVRQTGVGQVEVVPLRVIARYEGRYLGPDVGDRIELTQSYNMPGHRVFVDNPGVGTHTYHLQAQTNTAQPALFTERTLVATILKR